MPKFKPVNSLVNLTTSICASMVHKSALFLDSISWPPTQSRLPEQALRDGIGGGASSPNLSPLNPHHAAAILSPSVDFLEVSEASTSSSSPSSSAFSQNYVDFSKQLRAWLRQMPVHLLEQVVSKVICLIEESVFHDKDHKLILTIINIDKCRPSDFSFGLHSLLVALADTAISRLTFSNKLWFCISEFEEIGSSRFMKKTLIDSLPHFNSIVMINLSYVATDKFLFLVSQHCNQIEELTLDHSSVTDRGIRFLSGWSGGVRRLLFNENPVASFVPVAADVLQIESLPATFPKSATGCPKLRFLSLDCCVSVTDQALWYLLQHNQRIQVLIYHHQSYSVAEILCKEFSKTSEEISKFKIQKLALTIMDHPFPYGLNVSPEVIKNVTDHCPNIHTFNLVSMDNGLTGFTQMNRLRRATLELEDCFGLGLLNFIDSQVGQNLVELTLSCSSDPDSTFLDVPGGGQAHQLFNVGLKLARKLCPNLTKLSLFGCGLVSNQLMNRLDDRSFENPVGLKKLRSLILLTYYDDDNPVQTCEEKLLLSTLKECRDLECLSLEGNFSTFFGDNFLSSLLNSNPMSKLKILDIRGTKVPLTIASAKRCVALDGIQELRMSVWSISDAEFSDLVKEVKDKGWDLSLTRRSVQLPQPQQLQQAQPDENAILL